MAVLVFEGLWAVALCLKTSISETAFLLGVEAGLVASENHPRHTPIFSGKVVEGSPLMASAVVLSVVVPLSLGSH